jgi:hypothetical protein
MPRLSKLDASNSDEVCFMRAVSVGADVDFVGCEVAGFFSPGGSCSSFVTLHVAGGVDFLFLQSLRLRPAYPK